MEGGIAFVNKDGLVLGGAAAGENDSIISGGESEEQDKVMDNPLKNEGKHQHQKDRGGGGA